MLNIKEEILNGTHKLTDDDIMTAQEVADYLGIGRSTVFYYTKQGLIESHKVFGKFEKYKKKNRDGKLVSYGGYKKVFLKEEIIKFGGQSNDRL